MPASLNKENTALPIKFAVTQITSHAKKVEWGNKQDKIQLIVVLADIQ